MAISVRTNGDLDVEAGTTGGVVWRYRVPVPDTDPVEYADASLPGWQAVFQIRESVKAAGDPVLAKVLAWDGAAASLSLTAVETAALTRATYAFGVELRHPSGEPVVRLAQGKMFVSPEVVRD